MNSRRSFLFGTVAAALTPATVALGATLPEPSPPEADWSVRGEVTAYFSSRKVYIDQAKSANMFWQPEEIKFEEQPAQIDWDKEYGPELGPKMRNVFQNLLRLHVGLG